MTANRSGMAILLVVSFAFITAIVLFVLITSGTNVMSQNKLTLYNLQAHYLAQSAIQHQKLKLQHLPLETYTAISQGVDPYIAPYGAPIVNSTRRAITDFSGDNKGTYDPNYSLFAASDPPDTSSPIRGRYKLISLELEATQIRYGHDAYIIKVLGEVSADHRTDFPFIEELTERVFVSRAGG